MVQPCILGVSEMISYPIELELLGLLTDVDCGSLLTEYGCEANTDNVSLLQSHLH